MTLVTRVWAVTAALLGTEMLLGSGPGAAPAPAPFIPDSSRARPRPPRVPLVIGHAGSGFFHPANALPPSSLRSITRALQRGADGVEVDVQLSQDSIPVLYHDPTLATMTTGLGCVSQTPAAQLTRLRYQGGWLYDWRQHERLITLETLLAALQRKQNTQRKLRGSQGSAGNGAFPYLHLDLHENDACSSGDLARSRALARRLAFLLTRYHVPLPRVLVLTNRPATLAYLRQLLPTVPLGFEFTDAFEAGFTTLGQLTFVQAAVVHKDDINPARAARLHALGREVVVFGGRSARAVQRVVGVGPDSYQVDNVRQLRATLRRQSRVRAVKSGVEQ